MSIDVFTVAKGIGPIDALDATIAEVWQTDTSNNVVLVQVDYTLPNSSFQGRMSGIIHYSGDRVAELTSGLGINLDDADSLEAVKGKSVQGLSQNYKSVGLRILQE